MPSKRMTGQPVDRIKKNLQEMPVPSPAKAAELVKAMMTPSMGSQVKSLAQGTRTGGIGKQVSAMAKERNAARKAARPTKRKP